MKLKSKILLLIILIFTIDVCGLAQNPQNLGQNSVATEISALNFQIQPNRDIIDLLERLTITVKALREDVRLKQDEIDLLNQKVAQHEKISKIEQNQLELYQQLLQKQEDAFKILSGKVDNLDKIIIELKEANVKLEKQVRTEKRIGNIKAILIGIFALGLRAI